MIMVMVGRPLHALVALAFLAAFAVVAGATADDATVPGGPEKPGRGRRQGAPQAGAARELLDSFSAEERRELRKLFQLLKRRPQASRQRVLERLGDLAPEERLAAISRAKDAILRENAEWGRFENELQRAERECRKRLVPPELQKRLAGVKDQEERRRIVREFSSGKEELDETRRRLLRDLPADVRERVERLSPGEQARFLRRHRGVQLLRAVFPAEDARRDFLRRTPQDLRVLLEQERTSGAEASRPAFMPPDAWERWRALKPYERLRVLRAVTRIRQGQDDENGAGQEAQKDRGSKGSPPGTRRPDGAGDRSPGGGAGGPARPRQDQKNQK
jgi:hypothetical protein